MGTTLQIFYHLVTHSHHHRENTMARASYAISIFSCILAMIIGCTYSHPYLNEELLAERMTFDCLMLCRTCYDNPKRGDVLGSKDLMHCANVVCLKDLALGKPLG